MVKNKFWKITNKSDTTAELSIYGDIVSQSYWWSDEGDETSHKSFKKELDALENIENLDIYINSSGGDVFAGQTIYSMLKRNKAFKTVYVDGIAASIASVIAMAGDKIVIPKNAMLMIHNPSTGAYGDAAEFVKIADTLEKVKDSIVSVYIDKTGLTEKEISDMMTAETWLTGQEALDKGFADEVEEEKQIAASLNSIKNYKNIPENLKNLEKEKTTSKLTANIKFTDEQIKEIADKVTENIKESQKQPETADNINVLELCQAKIKLNKKKYNIGGNK